MNYRQRVQYALLCLRELDSREGDFASLLDISRAQGIPLADCREVFKHLAQAGIVNFSESNQISLQRAMDEVTALDLMQAIAQPLRVLPTFRMLVKPTLRAVRTTLHAMRWAKGE
jgi:DNA-binding IscR family transcriptional regulator